MFTGLIADIGTVTRVAAGAVTDVWIDCHFSEAFAHGESIACDGVCLTVVEWSGKNFKVQAAPETLRRSTLSRWTAGTKVNLERALKVGDRLGGHLVQGHVDGVGQVQGAHQEGGSLVLRIAWSEGLAPFFVEKGSICVDGVSLTVTRVDAKSFSVMLIPETQTATTLGHRQAGDPVNLEVDVIGKYVARMMGQRGGLTLEQLQAAGFTP